LIQLAGSSLQATRTRFTEDIRKIILRQFPHLRSSFDNDLIHRTLTTCLHVRLFCM